MASAQDCDPKRGEPPSSSSHQSVEVLGWRELWCYGNNCVGPETVTSGEPPSRSSPQPVEVLGWRELWCYGNGCVGPETATSGEPLSSSSPQSVEVLGWRDLWCYGNNYVGPETVTSVDFRTAENGTVRAPVNSGNPPINRDDHALKGTHKIYLSFSGSQAGFAEQLCVDLRRLDRHAFFDKDRKYRSSSGEEFPPLIFRAINQCEVGVVILSEEYFTLSTWPMTELVAMAKRKDEGFPIIPVYFGIPRSECRNPVNQGRWLKTWEQWAESDKNINIQEWKQALTLFGPVNSLIYKERSSEVTFREEIVEAVCQKVPPATRWDDSHVRAKLRFCQVLRERIEGTSVCQSYGVRVLGLYGTGGIGKSTMCKVLCNEYFTEFQGRVCHLEFGNGGTEQQLLEEALKRLTDIEHETLKDLHIDKCRYALKRDLYQRSVFLAIDNIADTVESIQQAKTYLKAGYNQGSIVIVAARSLRQLTGLGISESECLEMPELDLDEARSLFLDQFEQIPENIADDEEELLMGCVKQCRIRKGNSVNYQFIPLFLKELGTQLSYILRFNPRQWAESLEHVDTFNLIRQIEDRTEQITFGELGGRIEEN